MAEKFSAEFIGSEYQTVASINRVWNDGQHDVQNVEIKEASDKDIMATGVVPELLAWYSLHERVAVTLRHPDVPELRPSLRNSEFKIYEPMLIARSEEPRYVVDRDGKNLQFQYKSEILDGKSLTPYMTNWLGAITRRARYYTFELTELQKMLPGSLR